MFQPILDILSKIWLLKNNCCSRREHSISSASPLFCNLYLYSSDHWFFYRLIFASLKFPLDDVFTIPWQRNPWLTFFFNKCIALFISKEISFFPEINLIKIKLERISFFSNNFISGKRKQSHVSPYFAFCTCRYTTSQKPYGLLQAFKIIARDS